ncbi:leucine-rich repeat protein [Perkinsela sp. CCAP 1560/4]|nr:leucine-rich repeat protein [Perkinsela sp. CCAP 1560/4]|eukprot:KNH07316.1 leucine-rich repeat protein [Perkinsela sp. CCAP 1560/4]
MRILTGIGSAIASSSPTLFTVPRRGYLTKNRSRFAVYINRHGHRTFPPYRHPQHFSMRTHARQNAAYFWTQHINRNISSFLPRENYITADWTGKFYLPHNQIYTLAHYTSGVAFRVRRYPLSHQFHCHSQFMIGKPLYSWSLGKPALIDEATLTKNERAALVKKGYIAL